MASKLTVQFSDGATRVLEELASKNETTKTDILRRALALYDYVEEQVADHRGRNLSITDTEGKVLKDIILKK
jgi:predicted transcriptional regulator